MKTIIQLLAEELGCKEEYVNNVVTLLDEGNTIPFIARYRKEAHGAMDDTALRTLETRLQYLRNLQARRDEVKSSIEAQGKLTDELALAVDNAATLAEVEDLYRPYKQKRRTRATIAKEKGLDPLADAIFVQDAKMKAPEELAKDFLNPDLGVETIEDALSGASDIIAERISDDAELRKSLRARMQKSASFMRRATVDCPTLDVPALIDRALAVLQSLEPAGVGARSVEECLLLQLQRRRPRRRLLAEHPPRRHDPRARVGKLHVEHVQRRPRRPVRPLLQNGVARRQRTVVGK